MTDTVDPLWYKDAIIYEVHIKSFYDSTNDGVGDFEGLTQKLDYLKDLGITAIWLLPFYPSPLRDDGYDISDYKAVHPSYGTMRDFRRFVRQAHARGLKVITELVINHTSDQHPWFQRARHAPKGSRLRDFYVWSDSDEKWPETRIIFTDTEQSNWTWDPVAEQYYWHRFFSHQPDLNFDNPRVIDAVIKVMRFWLDMGVDGLRLDAIPYLVERDGTNNENLDETHAVLKRLRAAMDESHPNAFFLAEANQWPEDTLPYFGDGDECHMSFHFPLMPRMYMAMAQEDRHPITDIMRQTPDIPANCQWAIFLRNHDELTLEMVTERERDYLWRFYAADSRARINLGIRRRLAPLMDNDRRKIELLYYLLFSMPGTPVIYYGDEIGMGDNIFLGDRDGVRTPMQWSPDRNGGFSRANPANLYLPAVMDPIYGFEAVNVEAQQRSSTSMLNWLRRAMAVRQQHHAFGRGTLTFLYPGNRKVLAYLREHDGDCVLCVANLSRQAQAVELDLGRFKGRVPVELTDRSLFPPIGDLTYLLTLPAYGFYWFLLTEDEERPAWHDPVPEIMPDLVTLVLREGWTSLTKGRPGEELARDVLPTFLAGQRWFAAKGTPISGVRPVDWVPLPAAENDVMAVLVDVDLEGEDSQRYFLPLAQEWDETAATTVTGALPYTLARIRSGARLGALCDANIDSRYTRAVLTALERKATVNGQSGALHFLPGRQLADVTVDESDEIRRLGVEQSNSSILIGDKMVLKSYRKLVAGNHPEVEMGRFLTDVAGYTNTPPLLGSVDYVDADGTATALAVLQGFVRNQGDGWTYTTDYLQRTIEEALLPGDGAPDPDDRFAFYLAQAETLGQRTAELHLALVSAPDLPDFAPEPMGKSDFQKLRKSIGEEMRAALTNLRSVAKGLPAESREAADQLLERRRECQDLVDRLLGKPFRAAMTRHHGDYHLGQVLVTQADFVIVDFEGEPRRSLEERRAKQSPLRDVAGMIRSFDYAAWSTALKLAGFRPDQADTALQHARAWRDLASQAFLATYAEVAEGAVFYPEEEGQARSLLDAFVLEKAVYEIGYEIANRPSWVPIPVKGILELLDAHVDGGGS
ncbi:MAG: maltose alpha-D-glucosyltransferase [Inquilinaceae bacterium]